MLCELDCVWCWGVAVLYCMKIFLKTAFGWSAGKNNSDFVPPLMALGYSNICYLSWLSSTFSAKNSWWKVSRRALCPPTPTSCYATATNQLHSTALTHMYIFGFEVMSGCMAKRLILKCHYIPAPQTYYQLWKKYACFTNLRCTQFSFSEWRNQTRDLSFKFQQMSRLGAASKLIRQLTSRDLRFW